MGNNLQTEGIFRGVQCKAAQISTSGDANGVRSFPIVGNELQTT
jgi:hypothetical protein